MADPIPTADPALLAAQSKAGQAGVDAYQAAISTLQSQRQQSVQQAMQEAAMRGSPAPAADSQVGTISSPYDQRIASLTQSQAAYHADMASRAQRMDDYNAAVQGARSFIPLQTEQAVAPIRQQGENAARQEQIRGEQNVFGIQADTQLQMAKIQAAVIAAQIAAAKAAAKAKATANTLNQGELQAMLSQGAQDILSKATSSTMDLLGANQAQVQQAGQAALPVLGANAQKQQQAAGAAQAGAATLMLMMGGAGGVRRSAAGAPAAPTPSASTPLPPPAVSTGPSVDDPYAYAAAVEAAKERARRTGMSYTAPTQTPSAPIPPPAQVNMAASLARLRQVSQAADQRSVSALGNLMGGLRNVVSNATAKVSSFDPVTGRQMLISPQQASTMKANNPFEYGLLSGAAAGGRAIASPGMYSQYVIGDPTADIRAAGAGLPNNAGVPSNYSVDAVRAAYEQAAEGLAGQGYQFSGPDVANAEPKKFSSIYDLLNSQSSQDVFKAGTAQQAAAAKAQTAGDKTAADAAKVQADADVRSEFGRGLPAAYGSSVDITNALRDKPTLDQFDTLYQSVLNARKGMKTPTHQAIVDAITKDAAAKGQSVNPWLLSLAVAKAGYV